MIELVLTDRCTGCGICVSACPTHVFDPGADGVPVTARQEDCQTCFMCELYCPADALYVGPNREAAEPVEPATILASGLLGQFRRDSGWDEWASEPPYRSQFWRMRQIMGRGRDVVIARREARKAGSKPEVP